MFRVTFENGGSMCQAFKTEEQLRCFLTGYNISKKYGNAKIKQFIERDFDETELIDRTILAQALVDNYWNMTEDVMEIVEFCLKSANELFTENTKQNYCWQFHKSNEENIRNFLHLYESYCSVVSIEEFIECIEDDDLFEIVKDINPHNFHVVIKRLEGHVKFKILNTNKIATFGFC